MITSIETNDDYRDAVTTRFKKALVRLYQGHLVSQKLSHTDHDPDTAPVLTAEQRREIRNRLTLAKELASTLLSGEVEVHPQIAAAVENLSANIVAKYGLHNFSIIVMGSHATGAYATRQLFGTQVQSDLDWGIVCDRSTVSAQIIEEIMEYANDFFQKQQYFLDHPVKMCAVVNPKEFLHNNLSSAHELALDILLMEARRRISDTWCFSLINYFSPSFPAEVNQRNSQIILDALKLVYRKNVRAWEFITDKLLEIYSQKHSLKRKHLFSADNRVKSDFKRFQVSELSEEALTFSFEDTLRSTARDA
jgi:predicted nucleotidyltransferase